MDEVVDPFAAAKRLEETAEQVEERKLRAVRARGREAAVEQGRLVGERAADDLGDVGSDRDQRVRRAMRYAAWEFDGKPLGEGERYSMEFGVKSGLGAGVPTGRDSVAVTESLRGRSASPAPAPSSFQPDFKKGKK